MKSLSEGFALSALSLMAMKRTPFLGETHLGVVAYLQVVPPEPAFDNQGSHMARLNLTQKGIKARAVEVGAGVAIVPKVPDISQSMLPGVLLQIHFLVLDAVGLTHLLVITG